MDGIWGKPWVFLAVLCGLSLSRGSTSHQTNGQRSQICRRTTSSDLRTLPLGDGPTAGLPDQPSKEHATTPLQCLNHQPLVRVDAHRIGKRFHVTIQACENVSKILLHLRSPHIFKRERPHRKLVDCSRVRDTLVISKPTKHQVVTIGTYRHSLIDDDLSLLWTFQYLATPGTVVWDSKAAREISDKRWTDMSSTAEPKSVARDKRSNLDVQEPLLLKNETKLEECGKKRTCVRFGPDECQHMECDYLLTYTVTNHTFLELELSGKTKGWLALGLSSDDKMAGTDVIMCKRKSLLTLEIQALSMWINLPHTRPVKKDINSFKLVGLKMENGYIYCKVTRYIGGAEVVSDTNLDLTNNWFQLYAKGDIDKTGTILQHDTKPPTSPRTYSMLRPFYAHKKVFVSAAPNLRSTVQLCATLLLPSILNLLL